MKSKLSLLILEDSPSDIELIIKTLKREGLEFTGAIASDKSEFETLIGNNTFDLILADNSLPQFSAVKALEMIQEKNIDTPFILVTGTVSEEFAVDVIHKGADDYILKNNLKKLPTAITNALEKHKIKEEKILAEKALRESEQRFRILFEQASDGIVIANQQGNLTDANTRACIMTGYTLKELREMDIADTFFQDDLETMPVRFEELLAGKTILSERRVKRKDGTYLEVELSAKMLPDGRFQAIARDVTYRKKLETQLQEEKTQRQKELVQATIDGQEKERTEIGKELHDNINQVLVATRLFLSTGDSDPSIMDDMVRRSVNNISRAIDEIRKLSKSLVTPSMEKIGFRESLEELIDTVQLTTTLAVHFESKTDVFEKLHPRHQVALYRIIQEQLNNIIKHADAANIELILEEEGAFIYLLIGDDGKGFDTTAKRKGIGLTNMQSRAELLNGSINIYSEKGAGCTVKISLPKAVAGSEKNKSPIHHDRYEGYL